MNRLADAFVAVPFVDLRRQHEQLSAELARAFAGLCAWGASTNGPPVASFERAFGEYCGPSECIGVASGLDALVLGLRAAGLEPGDEVVVPAHTFVATVAAVEQAGGTPVLADIDAHDYGLDPEAAAAAITASTRFLMPVHLYGQMANVVALRALAQRRGVALIEDACQA